jgi:hypothetical protein
MLGPGKPLKRLQAQLYQLFPPVQEVLHALAKAVCFSVCFFIAGCY